MTATAKPGDWWQLADCQSADPDLFFPISSVGMALSDLERAKAVCRSCQVRLNCLEYALQTRQMHGVWGGKSEDERRALLDRRRHAVAADAGAVAMARVG